MPLWAPASRQTFRVDNWGASGGAIPGTSVTPGASNAEGTYTQLLAALGAEVNGFMLRFSGGGTSTADKSQLADIGIDPAGGTSYTSILDNIVMGASADIVNTSSGHRFFFPMRIPSGATVACRIQGSNATAGTVRVGIRAYGQPAAPWTFPVAQYAETLGTITNSSGVTFTPGNAADGTYVSLGTTTRDLWWWQIGYQVSNGTLTAEYCYIDIGFGTTGNQTVIMRRFNGSTTTETCGDIMNNCLLWHECYCPVPAGTEIWVRGRCGDAPDTGYNAVAIGLGG